MRQSLFAFCLCAAAVTAADSPFAGMTGRQIAEYIRLQALPSSPVSADSEVSAVLAEYARLSGGGYRDYFSSHPATSITSLRPTAVVPLSWWGELSDDYALVAADLHNIVPANSESSGRRNDYPPGDVTVSAYDNGHWKAGIGTVDGLETNFYEPADALKGDFARIYMYMASVYPAVLWHGRAPMLFADGYYPLLTAYGRDILLKWHRADPVDDIELRRDSVIAVAQGNHNPFVTSPDIAEYIWGASSDMTYPATPPDDPLTPDETIMLKPVYSLSADGRIDLRSPYVATGSQWTFDGRKVDGESITLTSGHIGRHELTYTNDRSHGKILISIIQ